MSPPAQARLPALPTFARRDELVALVDGLDQTSLHWLAGYAAGRASRLGGAAAAETPVAAESASANAPAATMTVLYGSQTGNARRVAEQLAEAAQARGLTARLVRADRYHLRDLARERLLFLAISTQGEGDPPDDARRLLDELAGRRAPRLEHLGYAVFALGDSSYPQFCAVGRRIDLRLAELGAERVLPLAEADLEFDTPAGVWQSRAIETAIARLTPPQSTQAATVTPLRPVPRSAPTVATRERPVLAQIVENQRVTGRDSHRDVRHIELTVDDDSLAHQPGDALGVWPSNPPALVEAVLARLGLDGDAVVEHDDTALPLNQWLSERRELTRLSRPVLAALAQASGDAELASLLAPAQSARLTDCLANHQFIDLLQRRQVRWTGAELVALLRPLTPRLYSIASSARRVGQGEVHLTVAHVDYAREGERRWGAASHWLASREQGQAVRVYIEPNDRFRLPTDAGRDVILIGPGTGVAPFRAFLQERAETGANGRTWLFFGDRHFHSDFLYQLEWQQALRDGELDRLDLAFSRDQTQRIHVQDRLRERGRELWSWLDSGAYLYVCGGTAMARDVHQALIEVLVTQAGLDAEAAGERLNEWLGDGRYARDVY